MAQADAWDFGPGNLSSTELSWQDFSTNIDQFAADTVRTVRTVTNAVNGITQALGGTTTPAQTSTQPAHAKPGLPWWVWAAGLYFLAKEMK